MDAAAQTLTDAIAKLERKPSKYMLQFYIQWYGDPILDKEADYTEESWAVFIEAYEHAVELNENDSEDLTQAELDEAGRNLYNAYAQLVKKEAPAARSLASKVMKVVVDKTLLKAAIKEAESLNPARFTDEDGFTTSFVKELIYRFENLEYLEDGKVTVKHVDENGKEIAESTVLEAEIGTEYKTTALEIEGYELVVTPENADGTFDRKDQVVTYQYKKVTLVDPEAPVDPADPEAPDVSIDPERPLTPDNNGGSENVNTSDIYHVNIYASLFIISALGYYFLKRKKHLNMK